MKPKVRWGVLSVSKFAMTKWIPAVQRCQRAMVAAIASRDAARAAEAAAAAGIPKSYGSYEELLADPEIDAIYNPLPNHLHVEWTVRAAEAGKHVMCEKPLSMNIREARKLLAVRENTGLKIGEGFMVRTHPQWVRAREIATSGRLGELRSCLGYFSYYNRDPKNIRNILSAGGGALYDIGCYPITTSRFVFAEEPVKVYSLIKRDPELKTDILTSVMLEYPSGHAAFTCSTQAAAYQRMHFVGTKARLEVEIPFNAPNDRPCRILIDDARDLFGGGVTVEQFETCDQYTVQGDAFSRAIQDGGPTPVSLEDSLRNMAVIDAAFRSASSGNWEVPELV